MKKNSMKGSSAIDARVSRGRVIVTEEIRRLYAELDKSQGNDPDAPPLPPEVWANAVPNPYYRPKKEAVNARIDADAIAWLKSKGEGHLTRMNEILRRAMVEDMKRQQTQKAVR
jgi:uncharacterized protein (DUF4415 family)